MVWSQYISSARTSFTHVQYTDKKENKIFLIYEEIQNGAVAKSYMRKGFIICTVYEEMRIYLTINEENLIFFFISVLRICVVCQIC